MSRVAIHPAPTVEDLDAVQRFVYDERMGVAIDQGMSESAAHEVAMRDAFLAPITDPAAQDLAAHAANELGAVVVLAGGRRRGPDGKPLDIIAETTRLIREHNARVAGRDVEPLPPPASTPSPVPSRTKAAPAEKPVKAQWRRPPGVGGAP